MSSDLGSDAELAEPWRKTPAGKEAQRMGPQEVQRKAKEMIRMVLFHEPRRVPIKREDISKKLLADHSRAFPVVLERANAILRDLFALEITPLTTTQPTLHPSFYILTSTLPPDVSAPEQIAPRYYASTALEKSREAYKGLTLVVLSLILVHDRQLHQDAFVAALRKLGLDHMDTNAHPSFGMTVKHAIERMIKEHYVERVLLSETGAPLTGAGRGRGRRQQVDAATHAGDTGINTGLLHRDKTKAYVYTWGGRAKVEVGEQGVLQVVKHVYGGEGEEVDIAIRNFERMLAGMNREGAKQDPRKGGARRPLQASNGDGSQNTPMEVD